ncbi:alkaline phosphatase-like isoform X2 [Lytechinus variegatus]|uniref:alkaline phosphatase-like isoform X2 n=1 Tax=Lytechinus variegatus TaxID=7654 RepID=UPI001BB24C9E|nr:alkaline phosphatase-like isoform X2 [Lytechinus variegatus]
MTPYRVLLLFLSAILNLATAQDAAFWNNQAQTTLRNALNREQNRGIAKNVIFFLGDGMDITTSTASRILRGQLNGETGEEDSLIWDTFPHVALSKTYNTDQQIADSAGTATAFLCGVKAKAGTLGIDDGAERGNCASVAGSEVDSILVQANRAGKATGLITTARITHATPAAAYAHSPERDWEFDGQVPDEEADDGCIDIARQLVEENNFINVILGGGRANFLPNTTLDPEYAAENTTGSRRDSRNLIDQWLSDKASFSSHYVWNKTAFEQIDPTSTEFLMGLFEPSHMRYEVERLNDTAGEPSIVEMTEFAINLLSKRDEDGYFLMVESGRIDHAHHDSVAYKALTDTIAFHEAVERAVEMTDSADTLIVVTADHGHAFTIGGYASRGNPIFGYDDWGNGTDGKPYLTLSYASGPGGIRLAESYINNGERPNHVNSDYNSKDFVQDATVPLNYEPHGGADVAIYAHGPWAHLYHGTQEQNYIPHVIRYAACYGDSQENACTRATEEPPMCTGSAHPTAHASCASLILLLMYLIMIMFEI